jgi:tetratricopeptide (TPR) repeat protein
MTTIRSNEFRKVIRVFIASPGDLEAERHCFREIIDEVNRTKANSAGVQLEARGWEDTLPGRGRPQKRINADIEECDLVVMLLWKRWGTPTGKYSSGFEEEYELAKQVHEKHDTPETWLYFRKVPDDMLADPGEQLKQVLGFREKIVDERPCMYKAYEDEDHWERLFRENLSLWLDDIPPVAPHTEIGIEERMQLKESEIKRLKAERGTEKQNSQTKIRTLALTRGIEAIENYRTEESVEDQRRLKESEDEIKRLTAELETEKQNSQTKIRTLALTLGIEALEKADSGQITRAEEYFAKSIASYPNPSVINEYGLFLKRIGMLKRAEEKFSEVIKVSEETGNNSLVAAAYGNLGNVYQTHGDIGRAEEMYRKSLAINEELGLNEGMAIQYGNLGIVYQIRGDLDRAEEMHRKALAIEEELGRKEGIARQYGSLGNVYQTRGDLDRAEEMHRKSLAIEEELGRKEGLARQYGNLGNVYQTRGDLDRAEEMYGKSLAINEELGRKEGMAIQYGNLGNVYQTRGDLDIAEEMYGKSLAINKGLELREGMATAYGNLGIVYQIRGDLYRAEEMHRKSLAIDEELGRKEGMARQYGNLGNVYKTRGDLDRAEEMYKKSLELFISIGSKPMIKKLELWIDALKRGGG